MGSYGRRGEPVFLKADSTAQEQLQQLEALLKQGGDIEREKLEQDIRMIRAGITGEEQILFELRNSHLPMYVLHDLLIRDGELSAQIDFVVVTPKVTFFLECKNLFGDICIDADGSFIRTLRSGGKTIREGIYSPVTQNERHMELVKERNAKTMGVIRRSAYLRWFSHFCRPLVVLANSKSVLDAGQAPEYIREQVIRADQLIRYIKDCNQQRWESPSSLKDMERTAKSILNLHTNESRDYTEKYRRAAGRFIAEESPPANARPEKEPAATEGRCPRCGGRLVRINGKFGPFIGCTNYPECLYKSRV